jgi:WD40 repeat protein
MTVQMHEALQLKAHTKPINDAKFSPNGLFFATASDDRTVGIWHSHASTFHGFNVLELAKVC